MSYDRNKGAIGIEGAPGRSDRPQFESDLASFLKDAATGVGNELAAKARRQRHRALRVFVASTIVWWMFVILAAALFQWPFGDGYSARAPTFGFALFPPGAVAVAYLIFKWALKP